MGRIILRRPVGAPVLLGSNYDQGDTRGGGQQIVLTGTGFAGATSVRFGATEADFAIDSDIKITATLPAHAAGAAAVTVTTPVGSSGTLAFDFWSPSSDAGLYHWLRADLGASTAAGGTELTALADQSGTGDAAKDLKNYGATTARYSASDPLFGGQATWGTSYDIDEEAWRTTTSFVAPLALPYTAYQVAHLPMPTGINARYLRLRYTGSGTGAALFGSPAGVKASNDNATSWVGADPGNDTTAAICVVYADSGATYITDYTIPLGTGDLDQGQSYESLGTGAYPGQATRIRSAEIIVSAGAHDAATRRKYAKYFAQRYGLVIVT